MKYTPEQKETIVKKGLSTHKEVVKKIDALNKIFPITVTIENGFYIIESKMNLCEN